MRHLRPLTCVLLILALIPWPASAFALADEPAKVAVAALNLRAQPSTTAEVLALAKKDDVVTILNTVNSEGRLWYQVFYDNLTGYMSAEHLQVISETAKAEIAASAPPAELLAGTVNTDSLRLREKPSTKASVVETLSKNKQITVLSSQTVSADGHEWYKVNYNGKEGYVSAQYVAVTDSASFSAGTGTITTPKVNLRSEPSTAGVVLQKLVENTTVAVVGIENGWYKVTYKSSTGYIHPDYLTIAPPPAPKTVVASNSTQKSNSSNVSDEIDVSTSGTINGKIYGFYKTTSSKDLEVGQAALERMNPTDEERKIVETGFKYLGAKYAYGMSNGKSFDCSGFTTYVMKEAGHPVTRTSASQYAKDGKKVSRSELRPGDLVFFHTLGGSKLVSHVGIYIGDGYFVHAGSSDNGAGKCVKVNYMATGYYLERFVGAKRVL